MGSMSATPPIRPPVPSNAAAGVSPWTEHRNAQGRVYWYHSIEKRSVWEKPTELRTARERAIDSTPWKEYQSGERKYYVHSVTKESSWSLPKELKDLFDSIPDEPDPAATPMQHFRGSNSPMPGATAASPAAQPARPTYSGPPPGFASPLGAGIASGSASPGHAMSPSIPSVGAPPNGATPLAPAIPAGPPMNAPTAPGAMANPRPPTGPAADRHRSDTAPSHASGGEEAFMRLLRDKGVGIDWTWEQTMRHIITEPLYKALGSLAERKNAFSKHIRALQDEREQAKREQVKAMEPTIRASLQDNIRNRRIEPWLSYEGMLARCPETGPWKQLETVGMDEARSLWSTIRTEMRDEQAAEKREQRQRNKENLMTLLRSFEADVTTRWKDARQTIFASDEWLTDPHLKDMDVTDMIAVFDDLIKGLEQAKSQELKDAAFKRRRDERKRRDWFRQCLKRGITEGWMHARSNFGDVYQRFRDDPQFSAMLGQPGSSPLDLFLDVLDDLDVKFRDTVRGVQAALARNEDSPTIDENTLLADFKGALQKGLATPVASRASGGSDAGAEEKLDEMNDDRLQLVLDELLRAAKEERRRTERKLRHLSEDLRYALKKEAYHNPSLFEPEAVLDEPWDTVWRPRLADMKLREWNAFDHLLPPLSSSSARAEGDLGDAAAGYRVDAARIDEVRRSSWERFVKRQKEKMEEKRAAEAEEAGASAVPRKRRGEEMSAGGDVGGGSSARPSRRERRAGEATDDSKDRGRRERRAGQVDEPAKRPKRDGATAAREEQHGGDSEKEEGEV